MYCYGAPTVLSLSAWARDKTTKGIYIHIYIYIKSSTLYIRRMIDYGIALITLNQYTIMFIYRMMTLA